MSNASKALLNIIGGESAITYINYNYYFPYFKGWISSRNGHLCDPFWIITKQDI